MKHKFVEVTSGFNWGKFVVMQFDQEDMQYHSVVSKLPLLSVRGWSPRSLIVFDLETGEGATFGTHGNVQYDLNKHRIWVCPLFEPFLEWLYKQPDPMDLPASIFLVNVPPAMHGYRRQGPESDEKPSLYYTHDQMVLCHHHVEAAFQWMIPPYLERVGLDLVPIDRISCKRLECAMCMASERPDRLCHKCQTPLHSQWPSDFCSIECDNIPLDDPQQISLDI